MLCLFCKRAYRATKPEESFGLRYRSLFFLLLYVCIHTCTLNVCILNIDLLQNWYEVRRSLSCSVLSSRYHISPGQCYGNALLLDGGGGLESLFKYSHQQLPLQSIVLKLTSLSLRHILQEQQTGGDWPHKLGSRLNEILLTDS